MFLNKVIIQNKLINKKWFYLITMTTYLFNSLILAATPSKKNGIVIANNGISKATIVISENATSSEKTAAHELSSYLSKITDGEFPIQVENKLTVKENRIFVGLTDFSKSNKVILKNFNNETWLIKTIGNDLIIAGGGTRGTLYGVYHFLEDNLGVHWWNPWEETVPKKINILFSHLSSKGKPAFKFRNICWLEGKDQGLFAVRNRINSDGDGHTPIATKYGGSINYGFPANSHTFYLYLPPTKYFKEHPEWYSLVNGKRICEKAQLCLSNPALRKTFLLKLINYIKKSESRARETGANLPYIYSITQVDADNENYCHCDACQKIVKLKGAESGLMIDFVNYLADNIKDDFPNIYLETLAYHHTQQAPKNIKARDNVIVKLCDTNANMVKSIESADNRFFRKTLIAWSKVSKNLMIWDYGVTYCSIPPRGMPMPTANTYAQDLRFYVNHNVMGVFNEHDYILIGDMRDYKVWLLMKLLENPYANPEKLTKIFTDGFYGSAGVYIRKYLTEMIKEADTHKSFLQWEDSASSMTFLNYDFIKRAQFIFDQAEQAVSNNKVLLNRVRHARLALDRATVKFGRRFRDNWITADKPAKLKPFDIKFIAKRALSTWKQQDLLRDPRRPIDRLSAGEKELNKYIFKEKIIIPKKFKNINPVKIFEFRNGRLYKDYAKIIKDPSSESGVTIRLKMQDLNEKATRHHLPMEWGLYSQKLKRKISSSININAQDVPGAGYNWYKLGTFSVDDASYLYFWYSWFVQINVGDVYSSLNPEQKFDIWVSIKFEGPSFPYGKESDEDAVFIERVIMILNDGKIKLAK